ncbi:hypothetical protein LMG33818_001599 [Halomonadaceae bacterium LMG 33818]|uniref:hypothetical protein n=1 Tax=Cernens ardua TaxID=3402176 RepID=UPI003EDC34F6
MPSSPILWKKLQSSEFLLPFVHTKRYNISDVEAELLRQRLQNKIIISAKRFAKIAASSKDALSNSGIYQQLDTSIGRKAALVSEFFRNSHFISNCGSLDVSCIQLKLISILTNNQKLVLELGWGQAKRDAGLLRTLGGNADFAEIIAIARVIALVRAIELLIDEKVTLRVVTGGQRFSQALFIRNYMDTAYNKKRQEFSKWLSPNTEIEFDSIQSYWSQDEILARLNVDKCMEKVPHLTEKDIRFAIFAIDWYGVIEQGHAHGILLPSIIKESLITSSQDLKKNFIRTVIALIANPTINIDMIDLPLSREALKVACDWFVEISKLSADLYIRLGRVTVRAPRRSNHNDSPILLTVIEKKDHLDIPCLQLLGRRYGKTLPQHLTACIQKDGNILFDSLYLMKDVTALVYIPRLSDTPLAVTGLPFKDFMQAFMHINLFDDIELS